MKIDELIQARQHPAYKAVSRLDNKRNWYYDPDTVSEMKRTLAKFGWEPLGSGAYSMVFEHPRKDYILKIFREDTDYLNYLKYVADHQDNPHVPKLRGRPTKVGRGPWAVRMERLYPLSREAEKKYMPTSRKDLQKYGTWWMSGYMNPEWYYEENWDFLKDRHPRLYELMHDLYFHIPHSNIDDWHDLMQRGRGSNGVLVIIDPY